MFSSSAQVQLAWALQSDSIKLYVICTPIVPSSNKWQNGPSWLIVDSNEIPGGLASTDVTKEGFVRTACEDYSQSI
jgi:hypothetical protein